VLALRTSVVVGARVVALGRHGAAPTAHSARAAAPVLTVSPLRTGIEFVTEDGTTVRPPDGVLYPGLLTPGQKFIVEYSTADPELVRVAGRTASVGNLMVAAVLVATWLIAAPLAYLLRRRSGRPLLRRRQPPPATDPAVPSLGGPGAD
jgi:hypothetical protein